MESVWTQKAWNLININGKLLSLPALFFFSTSQFLHQHFSSSFKNSWSEKNKKTKKTKKKHATIFFSFCQYPQSLMDSCFIHIIFVLLLLFGWEIWTFFLLCNICYGISWTNLMVFLHIKKKSIKFASYMCIQIIVVKAHQSLYQWYTDLLRAFACILTICFPHIALHCIAFRVYHQKIGLGIKQASKQDSTLVVKMVSKFKSFAQWVITIVIQISPSHFQASLVEFYFCLFFLFFPPQTYKWWAMYNLGFTAIGHHNNQCLYTHTHTLGSLICVSVSMVVLYFFFFFFFFFSKCWLSHLDLHFFKD